jgi:hypothetical protein
MCIRKRAGTGLIVAAVVFAGACSDVPPTEPRGIGEGTAELFRAPSSTAQFSGGLDAVFVRLAEEVPGFGGLFFDETGTLNVRMTGAVQMSTGEVAAALQRRLPALGIPQAATARIVLRDARYDFKQLSEMRSRVDAVLGLQDVVFTDADEVANRLRIGVTNQAAEAAVRNAVAMAGVPAEAVIVELTDPIEELTTLRDRQRPVAGGLQIWRFIPPGSASICTLGFNVRAPGAPRVHGFVTNSHCTEQQGAVTGTVWSQKPLVLPVEPIGTEEYDFPFFTCPGDPTLRCRYADVAGARYQPGVENAFGRIYRTLRPTVPGDTVLTIDPANPMWTITDERQNAIVGDVLNKTGRTTGWTTGPVNATCVNTQVTGTDRVNLCQTWVTAIVVAGDSGSPVFERIGETSNVRLVGLLWGGGGGNLIFSPMENIRFQAPGPAPWITYPGQTPPAS